MLIIYIIYVVTHIIITCMMQERMVDLSEEALLDYHQIVSKTICIFFSLSPLCIFLFQWLTHLIQFISIQYFLVSITLDHKSRMIYIQSVQTKLMLGSTTQIKWQQLKRSINFPFLITRISCISWFPKKLIPLLCETLKLCLHDNEAIPWDA